MRYLQQLLVVGLLLLTITQAAFGQQHTTVEADFTLTPGQSLVSKDGRYTLSMQMDGNLVLHKDANRVNRVIWATATAGKAVQRCIFQQDGNLVLYGFNNQPVWAAGSDTKGGAYLSLQNDGNLVIYNRRGKPVWASGTDEKN